jgi:quercetin dioxygenase-like cupin family protein
MSPSKLVVAALVAGSIGWVAVSASAAEPHRPQLTPAGAHGPAHDEPGMVKHQGDLEWGPPPDGLPIGARAALLQGNPTEAGGVFAVRLAAPDGYTIKPHYHPTGEYLTVIRGEVLVGDGDVLDRSRASVLRPGDFAAMPAGHHHFAIVSAPDTVIQVHAQGPWGITYVDPADDPRSIRSVQVR